ncbi:phasin family protein [Ottowia sp.]|uniref:phasin family protein n=1 Tax=Ottowia sp. TaxID=1898956 RepID=UPI003A8443D2
MTTKPRHPANAAAAAPTVDDHAAAGHASPTNVWLAGMGALANAQAEGNKAFEALVKQGMAIQQKTQTMARARMAEATQQMEAMAHQATAGAAPWNRLGGIFEDRVAQALHSMGMPTAQDLAALTARVEALEQQLTATRTKAGSSTPTKTVTPKTAARKPTPATRKKA